MRLPKNTAGYTLVEVLLVVAIVTVVAVGFASFFTKTTTFFKRVRVRQQGVLQSRSCMDNLLQILRYGKAQSVVISTPDDASASPNSRIDFILQDPLPSGATAYTFYLQDSKVYAREHRSNGTKPVRVLATNAANLMFTGDSKDPTAVYVTLRLEAPVNPADLSEGYSSILLDNQLATLKNTP